MAIQQLEVKNFRVLRDVRFDNLPSLVVLLGANGTGKSTLLDVFSFLKDCLSSDVSSAVNRRGGFEELRSRGESGPIEIRVRFRAHHDFLYILWIDSKEGRAVVVREDLNLDEGIDEEPKRADVQFHNYGGHVTAYYGHAKGELGGKVENYELDNPSVLAIKGLGQFQQFPVASEFRKMIEHWYISDFQINNARSSVEFGYAEHLSPQGENVAQVAQFLREHHPDRFERILDAMERMIPGVEKVETKQTEDGRLILRFQDGNFKDPFIQRYVSDGTIKMFAYLVLLNDPEPHPLLAVEEPENQLYPLLLGELNEQFRDYARRGGQVFVSTHSPDFIDSVELYEIYWLEKKDGFAQAHRASDSKLLRNLVKEGESPGELWQQRLFEEAKLK